MHGETAAVASFSRRLVREKDAGKPLKPIIDQMNALARQYQEQSRPIYCAKRGFVDEVVRYDAIRAATSSRSPAPRTRTRRRSARSTTCCCRGSSARRS